MKQAKESSIDFYNFSREAVGLPSELVSLGAATGPH